MSVSGPDYTNGFLPGLCGAGACGRALGSGGTSHPLEQIIHPLGNNDEFLSLLLSS
jgi:hypothetical protein